MNDRRKFFRIHDRISLKYRIVQNEDIEAEIIRTEQMQNNVTELRNAFSCLERKLMTRIDRLEQSQPLLAEVLSLFDKKLEIMQQILFHGTEEDTALADVQDVNLSGSGLSFESNTPISEGAKLKLDMVLLPEYKYLSLYGSVVDCRKKIDDSLYRFNVAVEFESISNANQEDIIQHVLNKQGSEIKHGQTAVN